MRDTSDACIQSMHEVLLFNRIFNACSMTKGHWYEIKKENYWSFRMTSDVTCLERYKHINTTQCSLHRSLDFASSRILSKTCPALSWDQALLSFSWVNRFQAGKANWKVPPFIVQYLCTCNAHSRDYRDMKRGPPRPQTMHISGTTREFQECGQFWEKSCYTVKRVSLVKSSWVAGSFCRPQ